MCDFTLYAGSKSRQECNVRHNRQCIGCSGEGIMVCGRSFPFPIYGRLASVAGVGAWARA